MLEDVATNVTERIVAEFVALTPSTEHRRNDVPSLCNRIQSDAFEFVYVPPRKPIATIKVSASDSFATLALYKFIYLFTYLLTYEASKATACLPGLEIRQFSMTKYNFGCGGKRACASAN